MRKLQERYRIKLAGGDVASYARSKRAQHVLHDMAQDDEQWAVLFYALRTGMREDAMATGVCQQDPDLSHAVMRAFDCEECVAFPGLQDGVEGKGAKEGKEKRRGGGGLR